MREFHVKLVLDAYVPSVPLMCICCELLPLAQVLLLPVWVGVYGGTVTRIREETNLCNLAYLFCHDGQV